MKPELPIPLIVYALGWFVFGGLYARASENATGGILFGFIWPLFIPFICFEFIMRKIWGIK